MREWLAMAAAVPGFIGFAVGRTVFWDPLVAWRSKKATREQAVAEIAAALSRIRRSLRAGRASAVASLADQVRPDHRSSMEG